MSQFDTIEDLSKNLPLPLARTIALAMSQAGVQRFNVIFDAYRAILHYVSATAVAFYIATHGRNLKIDKQLEALLRPSLGHWVNLATTILKEVGTAWSPGGVVGPALAAAWLRQNLGPSAVNACHQLLEFMRDKYAQPMEAALPRKVQLHRLFEVLVNFRNLSGLGHGATLRERDAVALCEAFEVALPEVVRTLECLWQHPLSYLEEKAERAGVSGLRMKFYDLGIGACLRESPPVGDLPTVPGHLYLRVPGANFEPMTDLHPLLVYYECENCDREQVFFLVHEKNEAVRYVSFACGHHCLPTCVLDDLRMVLRRVGADLPAQDSEASAAEEILARLSEQRAREESRSARREILLPYYALPERNPHFKGREREIAEIVQRGQQGDQVSLRSAVQGMGGVGKTTLAVEIAWRLLEQPSNQSPDGILWHRVREEPIEIGLQRMATALRSQTRIAGLRGDLLVEVFRNEVLASRRMLVILDNADRIEPLRDLVPVLAGLPLLITSRREVPGFSSVNIGRIEADAAAQLFLAHSGYGPTTDQKTRDAIEQICEECGYLPLAVQLAACHLREIGLSPEGFLGRLRQRKLDLLHAEETLGREAKDRDIRTSFALSVETLQEEDRRILSLCGLFEGRPFSIAALGAVSGMDDRAALEAAARRLRRLSLIERQGVSAEDQPWIQLHPLLSEYALEFLPVDDHEVRQARRMKFYLDRFGANAEVFDSPEREHVLRALRWAQERGDHETVAKLARDRWHDVLRLGYKTDAIELLRRRMASAAELEQPVSLYRAVFSLVEQLSNSGWTDEARSLLARCRRFSEWEGTRNNYLAPCVRVALGGTWDDPGVYSRVVEAALTTVRSRDEPPGKSTSELVFVLEQVGLGQLSSALQQEQLTLKPPWARQIYGELRLAWSNEDTANLDRYRLALEAARAKALQEKLVSDLRANILPGLVAVAVRTGQTEGIDALLAEWKQLIERSRDPAEWLKYYEYRAHLEVGQGRISEAVRHLSRAIEIDEASAIRGNPFDLETMRALRDAMAGDTKTARQRLEQLREQALRWSYGFNRLEWLAISAYTAARSGDDRISRENLAEYRRLYRDQGWGEKPGGNEALLRQLPAEIQTGAGQILARGVAPSRPTGFIFERDVPVSLPTRVRSRRDNRIMLLVPHGFAPIDGKRQPWLVPAFYIDAEPVTPEQYSCPMGCFTDSARTAQLPGSYIDSVTFVEAREFALRAGKELPEDFDLWRAAAAFSFPAGLAQIGEHDLLAGLAAGPLPLCPKLDAAKWQKVVACTAAAELCDQIVARYCGNMSRRVIRAVAASLSLPVQKRLALIRASEPIDGDRLHAMERLLEREASLLDGARDVSELSVVWWVRLQTLANLLGLEVRSGGNAVTGTWTRSRPNLGPRSRRPLRVAFVPEPRWEPDARTSRLVPVALPENERLYGLGIRCIRRINCASDVDDLEPLQETIV